MTPRVTVYISPDHDLFHTSLLLSGVCALEGSGAITLTYTVPRGDDRWLTGAGIVVCMDIARDGGSARRIAIDLRDGEGVSRPILDRVDRYFKRAFFPPELDRLDPELAAKMTPYGLNFPMRTPRSTRRLLGAIGWSLLRRGRAGVGKLRELSWAPGREAFEQGPDTPVEAKVDYQPRLWASEAGNEVEPLNMERLAIVRALRQAFGERFVGGLVPTPLALAQFPDEVTPHSSKKVHYLAQKKRCLVSVYTRGLEHSLAFKLGETLAASQCLVSAPLRYSLPVPLVPGTHYLPFDTPDECVAACEALLTSPERARAMRHANHDYYASEVEPSAHAAKVIAAALQQVPPG